MDRLQATICQKFDPCENQGLKCVVQQVEEMESDEPPSYHEPFLLSNELSYPPQSPMDDTLSVLLQEQREMQRTTLEFVATLTEVVGNLASLRFDTQSTPMATCGKSIEERSMKETLETPVDNEERDFVLEQVEEAVIVEEEEVVEDLGDTEPPWESRVVEYSSKKIEIDVEEVSAQPPWHIPYEELDGIDQEASSLGDDDHESSLPSDESTSANELVEYEDPFLIESENEVEVEVLRQGWTGVEYAVSRPLDTSLPRLPSTPSFKWVKLISIHFTVPLEYGILETDGQLRKLCGIKRKRRMFSGWSWKSRLIKVEMSRAICKGWTSNNLVASKRRVWYFSENSDYLPPRWNNDDQLEDGCRNRIWDPGIHEDPLWELKAFEKLHQGLATSLENVEAYWKSRRWWTF
ncbi:uncharacterized protein [Arachis hypogaea]|uniref:uncharacterized protein n=1 Tax=Arachis hypogaea TaxID=3818 RepID=UPI003B20D3BA